MLYLRQEKRKKKTKEVNMDMKDVPKRFIIRASHPIMKSLELGDNFGVFLPAFGVYVIFSEERGTDEFTGCPEDTDVEWLD